MRENKKYIPRDKQGKPHGYCQVYDYNGFLDFKGSYIHGNKYGYCEEYYVNGQLVYKGLYVHGKKYGNWKRCYDCKSNGEIDYEGYYYNDEIVYKTSKNKLIL